MASAQRIGIAALFMTIAPLLSTPMASVNAEPKPTQTTKWKSTKKTTTTPTKKPEPKPTKPPGGSPTSKVEAATPAAETKEAPTLDETSKWLHDKLTKGGVSAITPPGLGAFLNSATFDRLPVQSFEYVEYEKDKCVFTLQGEGTQRIAENNIDLWVWNDSFTIILGFHDLESVRVEQGSTPDESILVLYAKEGKPLFSYSFVPKSEVIYPLSQKTRYSPWNLRLNGKLERAGDIAKLRLFLPTLLAGRVSDAVNHAMKLCGGGRPKAEPF